MFEGLKRQAGKQGGSRYIDHSCLQLTPFGASAHPWQTSLANLQGQDSSYSVVHIHIPRPQVKGPQVGT